MKFIALTFENSKKNQSNYVRTYLAFFSQLKLNLHQIFADNLSYGANFAELGQNVAELDQNLAKLGQNFALS